MACVPLWVHAARYGTRVAWQAQHVHGTPSASSPALLSLPIPPPTYMRCGGCTQSQHKPCDAFRLLHTQTADVWPDAFTTEVAEEFITLAGEPGSLKTAWRVHASLSQLSYTQFWALVGEGRVDAVRFYGPEQRRWARGREWDGTGCS